MRLPTITSERLPMVCFLSGLLLNAAALFVGLENSVAFAGLLIGCDSVRTAASRATEGIAGDSIVCGFHFGRFYCPDAFAESR